MQNFLISKFSQVDDKSQQISISIIRSYKWKDDRIEINFSHPYWQSLSGDEVREYIRLDGDFATKCLWMPNLRLFDSKSMKLYDPSPNNLDKIPMKVSLNKNGWISVSSINLQLKMSCHMNFKLYPFDKQVMYLSKESI